LKNWAHTHTQKTYQKTSNVKTNTTSYHKKEELVNCKIIYLENHIDYTRYLLIYLNFLPKEALAIIKEK
jgi:hypothetical protein